VEVSERVESLAPREKDAGYYTTKLERILLAKGFDVVASEVLTRAKNLSASSGRSFAERVLLMGKETEADAVLSVQTVRIAPNERFLGRYSTQAVSPEQREQDDDGRYFLKDSDQCLFRVPFYEVTVAAKLIHVSDGHVLWMGEGTEKSLDAMPKSWVAKLDDECQVREQVPFNYREYLASEEAFESTVNQLLMRLIEPLRVRALKPRPAPATTHDAVVPKQPEPAATVSKPVALGSKMATITSGRAILRDLPQSDSLRLRLVDRGAKVELLQSSAGWHKIKLDDGTTGWMLDDDLLPDRP
jgi:hypothetical protein